MTTPGIGRRRVEPCPVRLSRSDRLRHVVVDVEDDLLCAVFAVNPLIVPSNDGKRVHDVIDVSPIDVVEMKKGGVDLASKKKPAGMIPSERRTVVADIAREE